jgi:uncharacterized protein
MSGASSMVRPVSGTVAIPARAGIGLRGPHMAEIIAARPAIPWLEVHAENFMQNGPGLRRLEVIRRDYPLSLHGVGLSLGTAEGVDAGHLAALAALVARVEPGVVSEHLSWSVTGGVYLNDLLPLPLTEEALAVVCRNVDRVQQALGRPILVENPSTYLRFRRSTLSEPEFLGALAARTGCRLLCDVNNIYVSAENLGFDPDAYMDALPASAVGEIHLAGHFRTERGGKTLLIDDHGDRVAAPVWALFARATRRFGRVPSLIEWDTRLPDLAVLLEEAERADRVAEAAIEGVDHARAA